MKNIHISRIQLFFIGFILFSIVTIYSCVTPKAIMAKSGAQLWGENCNRCHNSPPPTIYSDAQWEVVIQHMRYKANLTDLEARKVEDFLKSANN